MKKRVYLFVPFLLFLMACSNDTIQPESSHSSVSKNEDAISTQVIDDEAVFLDWIADFDSEHQPFIVAYYDSLDAIKEKVSNEKNSFVDSDLSEKELQVELVFKGGDGIYRVVLRYK